ncbi:hypothetical protein GCM10023081_32700 [Arthrobacter ginkgonis]|uniref:Antitoxin VbhA domain-containing protein n=1 Tax=Arthrobacter ginkgonis TaxID=1630594 RepID=A0ABP7CLA7_9MICC
MASSTPDPAIGSNSVEADQARERAARIASKVAATMALEGQVLSDEAVGKLYEQALRNETQKITVPRHQQPRS